jgi:multiple sugar transport system substrate-binding protein
MRLPRLLALFLLTGLTFSACVQGSPAPSSTFSLPVVTGTASPSPSPTFTLSPTPQPTLGVDPASLYGLKILAWHAFTGPAYDLFTRQAAQFTSENSWGILVSPAGYGDYASLFDAASAAIASGQPPDLVAALPEQTLSWDANGKVVDLTPYLHDPLGALGADALADFYPALWAQDQYDGRQLGIPAQRSARFIFYNQTLAHELGFDTPPTTPQEFHDQACAANAAFRADADPKNDGYGGWIVDTQWQTTYSWLLAFDGGVVDGSNYTFRTDPNLAALKFLKSLFDDHCAWISTEPTPFDSFARRSALFISADLAGLTAERDSMARLKNSDQWTVIPFPAFQNGVVVAYGPSYSVLKTTPARQMAAWLFARWLLSPESQAQWAEATGLFPLRKAVLPMIQPYRQALPQWDAAVGFLPQAQGMPQIASWRKIRYVLEDGLTVLFQNNLPADSLPSVLEQMDSLAQEMK